MKERRNIERSIPAVLERIAKKQRERIETEHGKTMVRSER